MTTLTTIKARARLTARGKPYFVATSRRGLRSAIAKLAGRAGTWSARIADGQGGNRLRSRSAWPMTSSRAATASRCSTMSRPRTRPRAQPGPVLEGALTVGPRARGVSRRQPRPAPWQRGCGCATGSAGPAAAPRRRCSSSPRASSGLARCHHRGAGHRQPHHAHSQGGAHRRGRADPEQSIEHRGVAHRAQAKAARP